MRRIFFLLGLWFELIAVFGLFVPYIILRETGTEVILRTIPVDPRSIFRGDYVTLSYEAGQNLPLTWDYSKPVFVVLEKDGEFYKHAGFRDSKPNLEPGQVCIRGVPNYMRADFPDIGQYFVGEGLGSQLENAQRSHRLLVIAAVDEDCRAVIKGVTVGPEAPIEPEPGMIEKPIPTVPPEETPPARPVR